jgi:excisionase family DNA binding protein
MVWLHFMAVIAYNFRAMAIWLDLDQLEQYLRVPKSTLYRLAQQRRIPGHKVGRAWRFDREEVDEWIKSGGSKPRATDQEAGSDTAEQNKTAS